jgi:acetoin utilization protein AcuC
MPTISNFFYRPEMTEYDFGPQHPLKPERLRRTVALLQAECGLEFNVPPPAARDDLARVHSTEYIAAVESGAPSPERGIGTGDNPFVPELHQRSLWYVGGGVSAARALLEGADRAFNIAGGLHHAQREFASGFCVYNDPAIAVAILRDRFQRVAYIDIDVHHGDGVQAIFFDDPTVMTISIHESGETLYPCTGFLHETGAEKTSVNIPLDAGATGDAWLHAFTSIVPAMISSFQPEAIVLQLGTDAHFTDPLAHLRVTSQEWLDAVKLVHSFGIPILACGGGGYELRNVPRMWAAACMVLSDIEVPTSLPDQLIEQLGISTYGDPELPLPRESGMASANAAIAYHAR